MNLRERVQTIIQQEVGNNPLRKATSSALRGVIGSNVRSVILPSGQILGVRNPYGARPGQGVTVLASDQDAVAIPDYFSPDLTPIHETKMFEGKIRSIYWVLYQGNNYLAVKDFGSTVLYLLPSSIFSWPNLLGGWENTPLSSWNSSAWPQFTPGVSVTGVHSKFGHKNRYVCVWWKESTHSRNTDKAQLLIIDVGVTLKKGTQIEQDVYFLDGAKVALSQGYDAWFDNPDPIEYSPNPSKFALLNRTSTQEVVDVFTQDKPNGLSATVLRVQDNYDWFLEIDTSFRFVDKFHFFYTLDGNTYSIGFDSAIERYSFPQAGAPTPTLWLGFTPAGGGGFGSGRGILSKYNYITVGAGAKVNMQSSFQPASTKTIVEHVISFVTEGNLTLSPDEGDVGLRYFFVNIDANKNVQNVFGVGSFNAPNTQVAVATENQVVLGPNGTQGSSGQERSGTSGAASSYKFPSFSFGHAPIAPGVLIVDAPNKDSLLAFRSATITFVDKGGNPITDSGMLSLAQNFVTFPLNQSNPRMVASRWNSFDDLPPLDFIVRIRKINPNGWTISYDPVQTDVTATFLKNSATQIVPLEVMAVSDGV